MVPVVALQKDIVAVLLPCISIRGVWWKNLVPLANVENPITSNCSNLEVPTTWKSLSGLCVLIPTLPLVFAINLYLSLVAS